MKVLETDRLILRQLDTSDAAFILRLVNDPSWLRYIGDKGVRSAAAATVEYAKTHLELGRIVAITSQDNEASCGLLKKLGFQFEKQLKLAPEDDLLKLFALALVSP